MSALPNKVPKLTRHKCSSRGLVRIDGIDHYLGLWPAHAKKPPEAVQSAYDALIAEWLACGRKLPTQTTEDGCTVSEVIEKYWAHVQTYYLRINGTATSEQVEFKMSLRVLRHLYANCPAAEFSPLKLKACRELMVRGYVHPKYGEHESLARGTTNKRIARIVRMFKWAVGEELVPGETLHSLQAVRGLQRGRSEARETEPILPVAGEDVEATLPRLSRVVAAMVRVQLLTGARPGEVCSMRPCDLDRTKDVWLYDAKEHKNAHRGQDRVIAIGPKAQEVLRAFLEGRDPEAFVFDPRDAVAEKDAARSAKRKTPLKYGNRPGTNRKRRPQHQPGSRYTTCSYRRAIVRAAALAGVKPWHPHQLRHSAATLVRREFGLEGAQATLGHTNARVTEIYAERNQDLATEVARKLG